MIAANLLPLFRELILSKVARKRWQESRKERLESKSIYITSPYCVAISSRKALAKISSSQ